MSDSFDAAIGQMIEDRELERAIVDARDRVVEAAMAWLAAQRAYHKADKLVELRRALQALNALTGRKKT